MGNRRTLIAAAAIVLAAAAGIGVYLYTSAADKRAQDKVSLSDAFVASQDIPKGTSGDSALNDGLITPAHVLRGSIPPAAVIDSRTLKGKVAASTISAKQFITGSSFVSPSQAGGGSLAAAIGDKNMVAVTVSVDPEHGVAHAIAPGDRVDIAVVDQQNSNYILQNVKVLAVGTETSASANGGNGQPSATATNSGLITFELNPTDALHVAAANKTGGIYLTLRPLASSGSSTPPVLSGR